MNERFLHYLWKYRMLEAGLRTTTGKPVEVLKTGIDTGNAGPDFQQALLIIDGQKWAGNIEIHLRSSDWYVHGHEKNSEYDNVILHVVWEHDVDVFRPGNMPLDTLELKGKVPRMLLDRYHDLHTRQGNSLACGNKVEEVGEQILIPWMERLFIERLEEKNKRVSALLEESKNDWEAVLFYLLMRNFGLKVNGESFYRTAIRTGFSVFKKVMRDQRDIEALLMGQAGLLEGNIQDDYFMELNGKYRYLKHKYQLSAGEKSSFFRLRPPNFPTIRLAQLADLYARRPTLFEALIKAPDLEEIYSLLRAEAGGYWNTHYNFGKESPKRKKLLTRSFKDLLLINTLLPLRFAYNKSRGKDISQEITEWMQRIPAEKNALVRLFEKTGIHPSDAAATQALIQLKVNYCDRRRCLDCALGLTILKG